MQLLKQYSIPKMAVVLQLIMSIVSSEIISSVMSISQHNIKPAFAMIGRQRH